MLPVKDFFSEVTVQRKSECSVTKVFGLPLFRCVQL